MKVLIAEDDDLTRRGLREVLSGEGYEVVEAADGTAALARSRPLPDHWCAWTS